jgi:hypothetical protein
VGLEDARRRLHTAASVAAQQLLPADYYKMTLDQLEPILDRLTVALVSRVPVAAYRQRFETERAEQFAAHRRENRRAKRAEFSTLHQIEGSEQVGVALRLTGEGWCDATVMAALYFDLPTLPYPRIQNIRLEVDLRKRRWVVSQGRSHEVRCGPDQYRWGYSLLKGDPRELNLLASLAASGEEWRTPYVEAVEECVVVLADRYQVPLSELEG